MPKTGLEKLIIATTWDRTQFQAECSCKKSLNQTLELSILSIKKHDEKAMLIHTPHRWMTWEYHTFTFKSAVAHRRHNNWKLMVFRLSRCFYFFAILSDILNTFLIVFRAQKLKSNHSMLCHNSQPPRPHIFHLISVQQAISILQLKQKENRIQSRMFTIYQRLIHINHQNAMLILLAYKCKNISGQNDNVNKNFYF